MAAVRIAVVADIHHGADHLTKRGTSALAMLDAFATSSPTPGQTWWSTLATASPTTTATTTATTT